MASSKTDNKNRLAKYNPFSGGKRGDLSLAFFAYVMILLVVGIVQIRHLRFPFSYDLLFYRLGFLFVE